MYEQSNALGGLLNLAVVPDIKWTLREYRDHLIHLVSKKNIRVFVDTKATPKLIAEEGYDEVVVAIGSEPLIPEIPGADGAATVLDALRDHRNLGENVVIIGGGEVGVETGIYLAQNGHEVTVLEMLDALASGCAPIHFRKLLRELWRPPQGLVISWGPNARQSKTGMSFTSIARVWSTTWKQAVSSWLSDRGAGRMKLCPLVALPGSTWWVTVRRWEASGNVLGRCVRYRQADLIVECQCTVRVPDWCTQAVNGR